MEERWIDNGEARLLIRISGGDGPPGLLIPSLGRGAEDFDLLASSLGHAGYRVIALQPRGIAPSIGPLEDITLHHLADDARAAIDAAGYGPAHVVGHAFGNRVARCLCVDAPDRVRALVLLAAGGLEPPLAHAVEAFKRFINEPLSPEEFLAAVKTANFAADSDPSPWAIGWFADTARAQAHAAGRTPRETWWHPGEKNVLICQALEDAMAPAANGQALAEALGDRASLTEIPGAGHAMLPEQPALIAEAVLGFLARQAD